MLLLFFSAADIGVAVNVGLVVVVATDSVVVVVAVVVETFLTSFKM